MDNILNVKVMGGNCIDIMVLDIVEMLEYGKKYIIYNLANSKNDDMYISILKEEDDSFTLATIEDPLELSRVEEYLVKLSMEE